MLIDSHILINKIKKLNLNLFLIVCVLFVIGLFGLYSAGSASLRPWVIKQATYFIFFCPICFAIAFIDINVWYKFSYLIYFAGLVLLFVVQIKGHKSMGATRWIDLKFIRLQPSELMKPCLILALARYFFSIELDKIQKTTSLVLPTILFFIPFILILKQPNLGTAIILLFITGTIYFCAGVQIWKFVLCFILILVSSPLAWKYAIKDYQKQRIVTFLHPDEDLLNTGYNIAQSKIAIGSGGLMGKGFLKGTQGRLQFVPEKQTDFIFTLFAEEFGFMGCLIIMTLYLILFSFLIFICTTSQNNFARITVVGVFTSLFCHMFVNIGMITGILPVVGMPLPLLSYGGSITASTLISIGLVLNAGIHKNTHIKTTSFSLKALE